MLRAFGHNAIALALRALKSKLTCRASRCSLSRFNHRPAVYSWGLMRSEIRSLIESLEVSKWQVSARHCADEPQDSEEHTNPLPFQWWSDLEKDAAVLCSRYRTVLHA